jgi:hypothetical protein
MHYMSRGRVRRRERFLPGGLRRCTLQWPNGCTKRYTFEEARPHSPPLQHRQSILYGLPRWPVLIAADHTTHASRLCHIHLFYEHRPTCHRPFGRRVPTSRNFCPGGLDMERPRSLFEHKRALDDSGLGGYTSQKPSYEIRSLKCFYSRHRRRVRAEE